MSTLAVDQCCGEQLTFGRATRSIAGRDACPPAVHAAFELASKCGWAIAVLLIDSNRVLALVRPAWGPDLEIGGARNTEVVRAKLKTTKALGLNDTIEDTLTLGPQYHVIRRTLWHH